MISEYKFATHTRIILQWIRRPMCSAKAQLMPDHHELDSSKVEPLEANEKVSLVFHLPFRWSTSSFSFYK